VCARVRGASLLQLGLRGESRKRCDGRPQKAVPTSRFEVEIGENFQCVVFVHGEFGAVDSWGGNFEPTRRAELSWFQCGESSCGAGESFCIGAAEIGGAFHGGVAEQELG